MSKLDDLKENQASNNNKKRNTEEEGNLGRNDELILDTLRCLSKC